MALGGVCRAGGHAERGVAGHPAQSEGRRAPERAGARAFNTPVDMTVAEPAVETFLPADPATAKYLPTAMN
ncbi:hypothetical protein GCM10022206_38970 [Streptomyces chiangmaiensis]